MLIEDVASILSKLIVHCKSLLLKFSLRHFNVHKYDDDNEYKQLEIKADKRLLHGVYLGQKIVSESLPLNQRNSFNVLGQAICYCLNLNLLALV